MTIKDTLPYAGTIRALGVTGAVLAIISTVSGVLMLCMKWAGVATPNILTQIPLLFFPLAFIALMIAMAFLVLQRRAL